ncbi:ABC transporter permease [Aquipuribacter nitratireducens]|uniref:ABC transporter permease n=1 Tax=Aquipuribacter nitratireducens TaxID=650104 RepID=A0ABW0GQC4_9MICO
MTTTAPTAASSPPDLPEPKRPWSHKVREALHSYPVLGPAAVLLLSVIIFSVASDRFLDPTNISLIIQQVAVVGVLALGQTLIILTAGIDLSVGAIMVLSSIVMAKLSAEAGLPGPMALLAGFAVGLLCGLVNGFLVTRLKLPPFIVTLGTLNIFFALNLFISESATVRGTDMSPWLLVMGNTFNVLGTNFTVGSVVLILTCAALAYALRQTGWGRHVYAIGDDREAARLSGIRVNKMLLSVYAVAGLVYGLAAWVLIGRIAAASPQAGIDDNLNSITAVVLGGTSLFGGRGAIVGTLVGALIVGVFRNGLTLVGIESLWQNFAVGVLVIVAVSIDQWIRKPA